MTTRYFKVETVSGNSGGCSTQLAGYVARQPEPFLGLGSRDRESGRRWQRQPIARLHRGRGPTSRGDHREPRGHRLQRLRIHQYEPGCADDGYARLRRHR
jgi:hypothetical protein